MFTATANRALLTTTTGSLPRPAWYTENLRGAPLSTGLSRSAYREQHFDALAAHVAAQTKAGIDIFVDGDARLDDDWLGRSWLAYACERIHGITAPELGAQPAPHNADKVPGDLMWEVIETRLTPKVTSKVTGAHLELATAWKAMASMTARPVKVGSVSAQILEYMVDNRHYADRLELLTDLADVLNREYHALADAGAPIVQVEEPAIHLLMHHDEGRRIPADRYVAAFNREVRGLRAKTEVWCHTCWGSPGAQRVEHAQLSYRRAIPYLDALDVDVLCFEGASNGGADFAHLGDVSKDKKVAIGVISHRTLQIERPEEVAALVRKALQHVPPERLMLTSDCGFGRQGMSRTHAFYKMVTMVRGANIVRRELGLEPAYIPACDGKYSLLASH